jgi:hypothetical protein
MRSPLVRGATNRHSSLRQVRLDGSGVDFELARSSGQAVPRLLPCLHRFGDQLLAIVRPDLIRREASGIQAPAPRMGTTLPAFARRSATSPLGRHCPAPVPPSAPPFLGSSIESDRNSGLRPLTPRRRCSTCKNGPTPSDVIVTPVLLCCRHETAQRRPKRGRSGAAGRSAQHVLKVEPIL